ncbi:MAG: Fe-S protein assembly co-chaperone HscB [Myxococcales bacterium]|nr:Fe-S protein assembly co-chaperone HscB [Myxococcales bacterium]
MVSFDPTADFFQIFALDRGYALDRDALERRYLELASAVHPDRFVGAPAGERRLAMERSSALNEAYRALRDPVRRAEYLVKLGGVDLDSSDPETGAPRPTQAFLIEMIELREQLEEARGDDDAVDELRDAIETRADGALDDAIAALGRGETPAAARALVVHRYLRRFLEEVDGDD